MNVKCLALIVILLILPSIVSANWSDHFKDSDTAITYGRSPSSGNCGTYENAIPDPSCGSGSYVVDKSSPYYSYLKNPATYNTSNFEDWHSHYGFPNQSNVYNGRYNHNDNSRNFNNHNYYNDNQHYGNNYCTDGQQSYCNRPQQYNQQYYNQPYYPQYYNQQYYPSYYSQYPVPRYTPIYYPPYGYGY